MNDMNALNNRYIYIYILMMWKNVNDMNDMKGDKTWQNEVITSMTKWRIWRSRARCWGVNSFEPLGHMLELGQPTCVPIVNPLSRSGSTDINRWHGVQGCKQKEAFSSELCDANASKKSRNNTSWHSSLLDLCLAWSWGRAWFIYGQFLPCINIETLLSSGKDCSGRKGENWQRQSSVSLPWPFQILCKLMGAASARSRLFLIWIHPDFLETSGLQDLMLK